MRRFAAVMCAATLVAALAASEAHAQDRGFAAPGPDGKIPSSWRLDQCIGGLTYGGPHKLALSYGGGLMRESMTNGDDTCLMAVGKIGLGAASASFGIGRSIGSMGSGVSLTGGVLRTFSGALNATARRTYVGGSVHVWPLLAIGGEIGYYVRLGDAAGASTHQRRIITWSAGFGF